MLSYTTGKLPVYLVKRPVAFGAGLRPNGSDSAQSMYGSLVELVESSVMASRILLRWVYEVLIIHTSLCTEKRVPYSTFGTRGATSPIDAGGPPHTAADTPTRSNVRSRTEDAGAAG